MLTVTVLRSAVLFENYGALSMRLVFVSVLRNLVQGWIGSMVIECEMLRFRFLSCRVRLVS